MMLATPLSLPPADGKGEARAYSLPVVHGLTVHELHALADLLREVTREDADRLCSVWGTGREAMRAVVKLRQSLFLAPGVTFEVR